MVIDKKKHNDKPRLNQGSSADIAEPNKIGPSTHFDFEGKNLTPYGGLFPVATMLEKLGFQKLVNETLTVTRIPRVMTIYQCIMKERPASDGPKSDEAPPPLRCAVQGFAPLRRRLGE